MSGLGKKLAQSWLFMVPDHYIYKTSTEKLPGELGAQYQK